jgi:hypothetical protein
MIPLPPEKAHTVGCSLELLRWRFQLLGYVGVVSQILFFIRNFKDTNSGSMDAQEPHDFELSGYTAVLDKMSL